MTKADFRISLLTVFLAIVPVATLANENGAFGQDDDIDKVVVYGRAEQLIGTAKSASDGIVGYDDFTTRPLLRVGELVEVIPGMVATQHSGSGKANQYFLRGFNLDHGTDFLATLEGMPINLPSHGHGQGYLDLNFIIPEVVETVAYRKGPYTTEIGDFSSAGSATFNIYDRLEKNIAELSLGEDGYYRFVSAGSFEARGGDLLFAGEGQLNNGPWVLDDKLRKYNAILKYSRDHGFLRSELIATSYHSKWNSTDQIPQRAVSAGLIDRMGYIDDDLGGETTRLSLAAKVEGEKLKAQLYSQYYDFNLFSNFTYFADDPLNGDEFEQVDNRSIWGGDISYQDSLTLAEKDIVWTIGSTFRYDRISEVGLHKTSGRIRHQTIRMDSVNELALGTYGDVKVYLSDDLRLNGGVRIDRYSYSVDAIRPQNDGSGSDSIISPKISAAYRLTRTMEAYANYGHGFHSNDVRGAAIKVDPVSGDPVSSVPLIAKSRGAELGLRFEPNEDLNFSLAGFWLDLDSELVFVGDAGTTEVNDGSRRYGIEFAAFWQANEWLAIDATAASTDAKFNLDRGRYIPGSIRSVFGGGATAAFENSLTASLRVRHFGSAPLIEDGSLRSKASTLVNLGLAYEFSAFTIDLDIFNVLNVKDADITYYYASQLAGEAAPVGDIHYHPVEPFTVRLGLKIKF
tara:strand:+ start:110905 stop:112956 length:2052 start_codon:yes stop_codon:yes gene_type:complete